MKVVIVGGTHGNERTGLFLLEQWQSGKASLPAGHDYKFLVANPLACDRNLRFIDSDLNRAFGRQLGKALGYEKQRAEDIQREILTWAAGEPFFLIDLHTTTSHMATTLVLSKPDPLSAWVCSQSVKSLAPSYLLLNESHDDEVGFLESLAPSSCLVEIGPVAQGTLDYDICKKMQEAVTVILEKILLCPRAGQFVIEAYQERTPEFFGEGVILHPNFKFSDYQQLEPGAEIFIQLDGSPLPYQGPSCYPIFIGESAYLTQNIAFIKSEKCTKTFSF